MNITVRKISEKVGNKITGPFSPMYLAKAISNHFEMAMRALYRLDLEDRRLYNEKDAEGITNNDLLVVHIGSEAYQILVFCVDQGYDAKIICNYVLEPTEGKQPTLVPRVISETEFIRILLPDELKALMEKVYETVKEEES